MYTGDFEDGKQHGNGMYKWPTGGYYYGEWMDDRMHGEGCYVRSDGIWYVGTWKEDHQCGEGKRFHPARVAHGDNQLFERGKAFFEVWDENKKCVMCKPILSYHDTMWSVVTHKKRAFLDVEVVCTNGDPSKVGDSP